MRARFHLSLAWLLPGTALLCAGMGAAGWAWSGLPGLLAATLALAGAALLLARRLRRAVENLAGQIRSSSGLVEEAPRAAWPVEEWSILVSAWREASDRVSAIADSQREFTANAAHELRTPLAALQVAGECALRAGGSSSAALREAVESMLEEAQRASTLVDRLLTLARAESGRLPVEAGFHPLTDQVASLLDWLRPLAAEKSQSIRLEKDGDWMVWADPHLLRLGLENLLSNAIRYAPPGSEILVRIARREAGGIAIEVVDEGPGIRDEEAARLFDRFYRGAARQGTGSGLGLAIARWGLRAFGAGLEAERRLEKGAVFRIVCPETEWEDFSRPGEAEEPSVFEAAEEHMSQASPAQVLARLRTQRHGLAGEEARRRREIHGPNALAQETTPALVSHLAGAAATPFNGVLAVTFLASLLVGQTGTAAVVGAMVAVSIGLRVWQERRALRAIRNLEDSVALRASVSRPGASAPQSVDIEHLVPGDVVYLAAGDMVPADVRLLSASGLQVSESALTGESHPTAKTAAVVDDDAASPPNICYMGTHVCAGGGVAVVFRTGLNTRLGRSLSRAGARALPGVFQRGAARVSWMLLGWMALLTAVVLVLHGVFFGQWADAFLFALAAAVGLTPELLPVVVNVNLARAARALARHGLISKSLPAVHALGAMDVLCLDKTGTLTEDAPVLHSFGDAEGAEDGLVLEAAAAAAHFQGSLQNALDRALRDAVEDPGGPGTLEGWRKAGELPYDHERRRVSVVLEAPGSPSSRRLICKGAAEAVLERCTNLRSSDGSTRPLDPETRAGLEQELGRLQASGLRVLGVAGKDLPPDQTLLASEETAMTFLGWAAFQDRIKSGMDGVVGALSARGIQCKILTGDHPELAAGVARRLGIEGSLITGEELRRLSDAELAERLPGLGVAARLAPADKTRVVRALQAAGRQTGFVGDGANDAAALRQADVGFVTRGAADIARDAADVILAESDLRLLVGAVEESRTAFGNTLKYINITASSNFGNALSVVLASFVLPFAPMRAIQLLAQNLLYDLAQFFLPWDRVDEAFKARPRGWSALSILRFMLVFGPASCLFDLLTFAVLWRAFGANSVENAALFHTGWFTVGLLTQLLVVHVLRTSQRPLWRHLASPPVLLAAVLAALAGLALPYSLLAEPLGFVGLPPAFYGWVAAVLLGYGALANWLKFRFARWCGSN